MFIDQLEPADRKNISLLLVNIILKVVGQRFLPRAYFHFSQ